MNRRFPILSIISTIFRIIGWLIIIVGLYLVFYEGIIEPNQEGHTFSGNDLYQIYSGLGSLLIGLMITAFGELIKVFFAIEENTRSMKNYRLKSSEMAKTSDNYKREYNIICSHCGFENSGKRVNCFACDEVLVK